MCEYAIWVGGMDAYVQVRSNSGLTPLQLRSKIAPLGG